MKIKKWRKVLAIVVGVLLVLVIAGLVGISGCGEDEEADKTGVYSTTATSLWTGDDGMDYAEEAGIAMDEAVALAPEAEYRDVDAGNSDSSIQEYEEGSDQKVIKSAILDIEVENGTFEAQFQKAKQLARHFRGDVESSNSTVAGEEDTIRSGTLTISVPVDSFDEMLAEAAKLGKVKYDNSSTDNVTDEYIDLQARITNQEAYVNSLLALLAKAETIQEILQVQQTVSYAQQELEQLKARMRYLETHTSYSTLTINMYEPGIDVTPPEGEWGFVQALKDAAHNVVDAFSAVAKGLGWIIPVLVIVGILIGIIYVTVKVASRKKTGSAGDDDQKTS